MNKSTKIIMYGFDKIGIKVEHLPKRNYGIELKSIEYRDIDAPWGQADGLILPSGIFEEFYASGRMWAARRDK